MALAVMSLRRLVQEQLAHMESQLTVVAESLDLARRNLQIEEINSRCLQSAIEEYKTWLANNPGK